MSDIASNNRVESSKVKAWMRSDDEAGASNIRHNRADLNCKESKQEYFYKVFFIPLSVGCQVVASAGLQKRVVHPEWR